MIASGRLSLRGGRGGLDGAVGTCAWGCWFPAREQTDRDPGDPVFQRLVLGLRRDESVKRVLLVRPRLGLGHGARAFEEHVSKVSARGARRDRPVNGRVCPCACMCTLCACACVGTCIHACAGVCAACRRVCVRVRACVCTSVQPRTVFWAASRWGLTGRCPVPLSAGGGPGSPRRRRWWGGRQ